MRTDIEGRERIVKVVLEQEDGKKLAYTPEDSTYIVLAVSDRDIDGDGGATITSLSSGKPTHLAQLIDAFVNHHKEVLMALAVLKLSGHSEMCEMSSTKTVN